jgi:hypothetical protein
MDLSQKTHTKLQSGPVLACNVVIARKYTIRQYSVTEPLRQLRGPPEFHGT